MHPLNKVKSQSGTYICYNLSRNGTKPIEKWCCKEGRVFFQSMKSVCKCKKLVEVVPFLFSVNIV